MASRPLLVCSKLDPIEGVGGSSSCLVPWIGSYKVFVFMNCVWGHCQSGCRGYCGPVHMCFVLRGPVGLQCPLCPLYCVAPSCVQTPRRIAGAPIIVELRTKSWVWAPLARSYSPWARKPIMVHLSLSDFQRSSPVRWCEVGNASPAGEAASRTRAPLASPIVCNSRCAVALAGGHIALGGPHRVLWLALMLQWRGPTDATKLLNVCAWVRAHVPPAIGFVWSLTAALCLDVQLD